MGIRDGDGLVEIHVCGMCRENPGPGGWGAVLEYGRFERELSGGHGTTTAHRMALTATVRAFERLSRPCSVRVHTAEASVREGVAAPSPVENTDLWQRLVPAMEAHHVQWTGSDHGDAADLRAGELAAAGMQEAIAVADAGEDECEHLMPIGWCSWCAPPRAGVLPRGYRTAGGRAYHNDPNCAWLVKGQRNAQRQGKNVHDIVPVAWASLPPGEREPCESCCTPRWLTRHGH